MSKVVSRRESLKLASAAAALGAGLGVVLGSRDADADVATPAIAPAAHGKIDIDAVTQHKIDLLLKQKVEVGYVQWKVSTADGQDLFASMLPEDVASVLFKAPAGTLQFKFYKPAAAGPGGGPNLEVFRQGVMQIAPAGVTTLKK